MLVRSSSWLIYHISFFKYTRQLLNKYDTILRDIGLTIFYYHTQALVVLKHPSMYLFLKTYNTIFKDGKIFWLTGIINPSSSSFLYIYFLSLSGQHSKTSIILDASKYIEDLKRKIDVMNQKFVVAQDSDAQASLPQVESKT